MDRFLEALASGDGIPNELFAAGPVLDATVLGWRFPLRGAGRPCDQYDSWCCHPATFEELEQLAVDGGEMVTYLLTWLVRGVPHAAHYIHVLRFDASGPIVADRFFLRDLGGQLAPQVRGVQRALVGPPGNR